MVPENHMRVKNGIVFRFHFALWYIMSDFTEHTNCSLSLLQSILQCCFPDRAESMYIPKYLVWSVGSILWPFIFILKLKFCIICPGLWKKISSVLEQFSEILLASNHL